MIIFLSEGMSSAHADEMIKGLNDFGVTAHRTVFGDRQVVVTSIGKPGSRPDDETLQAGIRSAYHVERILVVDTSCQLANRQVRPEGSVVRAGTFSVGGGHFGVIAGPCTVETERQTCETALAVRDAGATALRGGAFKPRTSPYAFQGLKREGLKILAKARRLSGLAIVTEAMSPEEVKLVEEYGDVIQIGARNVQNYRLLEAAGRARKPVLLKRGFSTTIEEWIMSAEYILAGGNDRVILCERGIRTFEDYTRFTLPVAVIPALREMTHLPVVVDPSHAAGRADFVLPLAAASVAAGADGLLVEVHPDPKSALCDGRQSLTFEEFKRMMRQCTDVRACIG
ncbi:MAG TPA: 3-deoxy-7-phosphoheptulonate synthase [Planctomycetaceae bacterium]|nr:3-deoxy-7-phosphoheptulonate synthase [Planctomycetaceae bacterium]